MKGVDIYNKKVHQSPLDRSIPTVETGFDIRNTYNLIAAIRIRKENSIEGVSNIAYHIGKFQGTSITFIFLLCNHKCRFSLIWPHFNL